MKTPPPVLYAEDDENDVFLMQRAFRKAAIANSLRVVTDGRQAVNYLSGQGEFNDRDNHPLPCLVLLDLKMPELSGLEVLAWLRSQPGTSSLPVVMFTSSNQASDIEKANQLGANDYLIKPGRPDELSALVERLKQQYLQ